MTTEWIINHCGHVSILHLYQNIWLHVLHKNMTLNSQVLKLIHKYLNQGICDGTHSMLHVL